MEKVMIFAINLRTYFKVLIQLRIFSRSLFPFFRRTIR